MAGSRWHWLVAAAIEADYRIVGGHMVSLLGELYPSDLPPRETADADFGASFAVIADPRLPAALKKCGYVAEGGNRFVCDTDDDLSLAIDILAPSWQGRLVSNQKHGDLYVDEIPGLSLALAVPGLHLALPISLTSDKRMATTVAIPPIVPALCLKVLAYASRLAQKDAGDVHRLLEMTQAADIGAGALDGKGVRSDARAALLRYFGSHASPGTKAATEDRRSRTRISALTQRVCS